MTTPATMQSEAMRRSGVMTTTATMQWGHPQPRSGEGDEAMRRSGVMPTPATIAQRSDEVGTRCGESGVNAQATHRPDPVATSAVTAVTRT